MELKYQFLIYFGMMIVILLAVAYFVTKRKKRDYKDGQKLALLTLLEEDPYYQRKKWIYRIVSTLLFVALLVGILAGFVLLARPYKTTTITEQKYSRDIILCIDISSSVDYLNKNIINELIHTVEEMKTERFGIVIFNTSPVLVSPLTDDYEYTIEQLQKIEKALAMRLRSVKPFFKMKDDYLYYSEFISGGTLVGHEERGSSLIGDGLASSVFYFSKNKEERTKVVIFTTDNDLQGEPLVTLPQAASLCEKNDIVVYGVGTKEMYTDHMQEMKKAVESTGGSFYLEEESGSFEKIIEDIEKKSKSLVEGKQYVFDTEYPKMPFICLLCSYFVMLILMKYTKR